MTYMSFWFYVFVLIAALLYYIIPLQRRWLVLLAGSLFFYWQAMGTPMGMAVILITIAAAYGAGLLLHRVKRKSVLVAAVCLVILP